MRFDSYHPAINLIYFFVAIASTILFHHPVFLAVSYTAAFAYSVKLNGRKAFVFNVSLIPLIFLYAWWYSYYNHFGITELRQNFTGNSITLEAAAFGLVIGVTAAAVIMFMSCAFAVFSSDKVVYLFGRVSPRLSLFFSIMMRGLPRIKDRARRINTSRRGLGRGCGQGSLLERMSNSCKLVSVVITWTLESFAEASESMKSRGYSLKGRKAFSIYRFDNRDRILVVLIFLCLTFLAVAVMFDQTSIYFDPQIIFNRITAASLVFYLAYAVLLLFPMGLQIAGEYRFDRLSKSLR